MMNDTSTPRNQILEALYGHLGGTDGGSVEGLEDAADAILALPFITEMQEQVETAERWYDQLADRWDAHTAEIDSLRAKIAGTWCEGGYVGVRDDHQGTDRATCPSCGRSVRFHRITSRFYRHLRAAGES